MAQFTARVDLHGATFGDAAYEKLHAEMESRGFERTIRDTRTGIVYWLPPAEYVIVTGEETNRSEICSLAEQAAAASSVGYSLLVTGSATCTWKNLDAKP